MLCMNRTLAAAAALLGLTGPALAGDGDGPATAELPAIRALDGRKLDLAAPEGGVAALVFYSTECPISNGYSPTLNAIADEFSGTGLQMVGLCVDPDLSDAELLTHAREYALKFPTARDRTGSIARLLGVTVTPEAVVVDPSGRIRYRGRIDDTYAARQKRNANPDTRELRDAIAKVLEGCEVPTARVEAVGCPLPEVMEPGEGPTYAGRVAAILQNNCLECHRKGQVGPFALESYEQARKRAFDIAAVVEDRRMPPWKPVPGVGPRFKHDKSLTDDEVAAIVAWAEAGAPLGDPDAVPEPPDYAAAEWKLGTPDLVLELPEAFEIPADGEDIYRCFVIPTDLDADTPIAAIEYRAGNRRVVHHVLGYIDTSGQARELDAKDPGPGYECFSGPMVDIHGDFGGWAPGNEPNFLPEGIGRILPKGADLIIQMHYHPSGKPETDRTRIGLYFSKTPLKQTLHWTAAYDFNLRLPAGEKGIVSRGEWPMPVDVVAYAVTPHMHMLGRDMTVSVEFPDGTTRDLIEIDDWDFNWQNTYYFERPIELPEGTKLKLVAHFDNSADNPRNPNDPPVDVKWGEATTDEMSIGFLGVVKKGQDLTRPGEKDDLREIFDRQREEFRKRAEAEREKRQKPAAGPDAD